MGRKSRLKRERRAAKAKMAKTMMQDDTEIEPTCSQLKAIFSRYSAEDVLISLNVSDLWRPNISSQVKHAFVFAVAVAMTGDDYKGSEMIETYSDFKKFTEQVYAVLPGFPILEDYVPEPDWGRVKFPLKGSHLSIFYGGAVERIPDFVKAFYLIHGTKVRASQDMDIALKAQHHILTAVDEAIIGSPDNITPGHIEIPGESFWRACRKAILSLVDRSDFAGCSQKLTPKLGVLPTPKGIRGFGDAIMQGIALPAIFAEVGTSRYPLAIRNSATTVIEYWAAQKKAASAKVIADFIFTRAQNIIKGPFNVVSRTERLPFVFSAAILGGAKPYLIIVLEESELIQLPKLEASLKRVLGTGDWALKLMGSHDAFQIRTSGGNQPNELEVIAVLSNISTIPRALNLPRSKARVLFLPDFVTIFDSIKDTKELDRYWAFMDDISHKLVGISSMADCFAAFVDSHELLVDGALMPDRVIMDPHWGSTWRYKTLMEYWDNAPPSFPDDPNTEWNVERDQDGLYTLLAKSIPAILRCTVVGDCVVHFMLDDREQQLKVEDGKILELLIHCLADALNQRKSIMSSTPLFKHRQIITKCQAKMDSLLSKGDVPDSGAHLFSDWQFIEDKAANSIYFIVKVNLQYAQKHLTKVTDASFEVESITAWVNELSSSLGLTVDSNVLAALRDTSMNKPRFIMKDIQRTIDVPEYAKPHIPAPEHHKVARRDLAIIFKDIGAEEGKYELTVAKLLIDSARDKFRELIHKRVSALRRTDCVQFCIEQLDALITKYDRKLSQINMSFAHEVDFDRAQNLADAHEHFIRESKNYRYLLECSYSMPETGSDKVSIDTMVRLVASIDWLLVLYDASDVLHNGLDVAGLELDHFFIPHVYYSDIRGSSESEFAYEAAETKLGVRLNAGDEIQLCQPTDPKWVELNQAFFKDTGVNFNDFLACLLALSRWPSVAGIEELGFSYSAPSETVRDVMAESVTGLTPNKAEKIISLACLNPKGIRRLLGKVSDESDVPLWEHNKRGDRYAIKPIIHDDQGILT